MSELKTNKIATNDTNNVAIDNSLKLKNVTTTQRDALSSPEAGDTVYNSTTGTIDFYNGSAWFATSSTTFTVDISYLVIAGGASGAGGGQANQAGGGGGAGGYRSSYSTDASGGGGSTESTITLTPDGSTNYTVTVGAGGAAAADAARGNNGSNSVFSTITSTGGGGGANYFNMGGNNGGSGGGGAQENSNRAGGTGTSNQGYGGGSGNNSNSGGAGGGGGAGAAGSNAGGTVGGAGGVGVASAITGSSVFRGGGGGGGGNTNGGAGGNGGGGDGAKRNTNDGAAGTVNTGGGGGGGAESTHYNAVSYAGGSGVVILRYQTSKATITVGAGLTSTSTTSGSDTIVTFTAGTGNVQFSQDNMSRLKVDNIEARSGNNIALDDSLNLKSYTTTQRDALTSVAGDTIYNTTTTKVEYYNGSEWVQTGPATLDGDLTYLGTYDYSSSTISGGITITTTDNGGYLDVANYSRFKIFITQAKNSGPYDMNFVWNARNADNSGNLSGSTNYTGTTYQSRGNNTNTINHGDQTQHYHVLTATVMDANNDSQATVMLDVYNLGNNGLFFEL